MRSMCYDCCSLFCFLWKTNNELICYLVVTDEWAAFPTGKPLRLTARNTVLRVSKSQSSSVDPTGVQVTLRRLLKKYVKYNYCRGKLGVEVVSRFLLTLFKHRLNWKGRMGTRAESSP